MFRPANNRARLIRPRDVQFLAPVVIVLALVLLHGCGARATKVTLTIQQLRDLEQCVLGDDQVERQNCVERLMPREK